MLYIWLVAQYHFQLYNVNSCFLSAFGTEQRKLYEDGICIYLCPGFIPAYRARHPTGKLICFHHRFSCYIECCSALNVWLFCFYNISDNPRYYKKGLGKYNQYTCNVVCRQYLYTVMQPYVQLVCFLCVESFWNQNGNWNGAIS